MTLGKAPDVPLEDIEWRIDGKPYNNRCRFVPYVSASTVSDLLDKWVTPGNWKDQYEPVTYAGKEALWCALSIRVGDEWVTKCDIGVPSNFEAQKGAVSDAFKRAACLKWGVARNVYSMPNDIWAPCDVRTYNNKEQAHPNDKSLPAIHAELKRRGYEASGRLAGAETSEDSTAGEATTSGTPATHSKQESAPKVGGGAPSEVSHNTASPQPVDTKEENISLIEQVISSGVTIPNVGRVSGGWLSMQLNAAAMKLAEETYDFGNTESSFYATLTNSVPPEVLEAVVQKYALRELVEPKAEQGAMAT